LLKGGVMMMAAIKQPKLQTLHSHKQRSLASWQRVDEQGNPDSMEPTCVLVNAPQQQMSIAECHSFTADSASHLCNTEA